MKPQGVIKKERSISDGLKIFCVEGIEESFNVFHRYVPTLSEATKTSAKVVAKFTNDNVNATVTVKSYVVDAASKKMCIVKMLNNEPVIRNGQTIKSTTITRRQNNVKGRHTVQFQIRRKDV